MPPEQRAQKLSKEGRLGLAIASFQSDPRLSIRKLASSYNVPKSTLHTRLQGVQPKHETRSPNRKLLPTEEHSLVQWILDLDRRGYPPQIIDVKRMADVLVTARGEQPPPPPLGQKWVSRFIKAQPELQTKWNRKYDAQRSSAQDPIIIQAWFQLVQETRERYGILDQDIYNFDETGFAIGIAGTSKVVTSSDTIGRPALIQPGNREWVTAIEGVNATGWSIPPFIILSGKLHQAAWYRVIPTGWILAVSDNGWTTNPLGLEWLKHFNSCTQTCTVGTYRLLIVDGHDSHASPEFDQYCTANNIISLCMPAHASHLLQPLDVGCYSPLKYAYGQAIQQLARQHVYHIDKLDFLSVYKQIREAAITEKNIQAGFQASGLVPHSADSTLR